MYLTADLDKKNPVSAAILTMTKRDIWGRVANSGWESQARGKA